MVSTYGIDVFPRDEDKYKLVELLLDLCSLTPNEGLENDSTNKGIKTWLCYKNTQERRE